MGMGTIHLEIMIKTMKITATITIAIMEATVAAVPKLS